MMINSSYSSSKINKTMKREIILSKNGKTGFRSDSFKNLSVRLPEKHTTFTWSSSSWTHLRDQSPFPKGSEEVLSWHGGRWGCHSRTPASCSVVSPFSILLLQQIVGALHRDRLVTRMRSFPAANSVKKLFVTRCCASESSFQSVIEDGAQKVCLIIQKIFFCCCFVFKYSYLFRFSMLMEIFLGKLLRTQGGDSWLGVSEGLGKGFPSHVLFNSYSLPSVPLCIPFK